MRATMAAIRNHGSVSAAARALGVPRGTMENRWHRTMQWAKTKGIRLPDSVKPGVRVNLPTEGMTVKGDTAELNQRTTARVRTLKDLVRVCEINTTEWEIERWTCNKWDMGSVPPVVGNDKSGWRRDRCTPVVTELYQVKVWLKRRAGIAAARAEIELLIADAKRRLPKLAALTPKPDRSGYMLELNIADLHNGKLAWGRETGYENYDGSIAERLHDAALDALLQRTSCYRFERIVIVLGNDLLHIDSRNNTTTAGTPQDTDSRYYKLFLATRRMTQRAIERCRKLAPVHVVLVPGNHDRDSVWHLGDSLTCAYDGCPSVTIDNAPTQRKYVEHGKVMLLFTHGDRGKRPDYPLLMATEQPQMFGRTQFREAHTGHFHQTRVQEWHGVRVRILPSLAGADAWHAENGYVGNLRAAEAFVWSASEGLVATAYYTAPASRLESTA